MWSLSLCACLSIYLVITAFLASSTAVQIQCYRFLLPENGEKLRLLLVDFSCVFLVVEAFGAAAACDDLSG